MTFWQAVGLVLLLFGWMVFGLTQASWMERMLTRVNAGRPPQDRFGVWGGPFHNLKLHGEIRRIDPVGYRRALLGFLIWALSLLAATLWVLTSAGMPL